MVMSILCFVLGFHRQNNNTIGLLVVVTNFNNLTTEVSTYPSLVALDFPSIGWLLCYYVPSLQAFLQLLVMTIYNLQLFRVYYHPLIQTYRHQKQNIWLKTQHTIIPILCKITQKKKLV